MKKQELKLSWKILAIFIFCIVTVTPITGQVDLDFKIKEARKTRDYRALANSYLLRAENQLESYKESKSVFEDLNQSNIYFRYLKDSLGMYKVQLIKAKMYMINQNYLIRAERQALGALTYFHHHQLEDLSAKAHKILSSLYDKRQDYEKALWHISRSIEYAERIGDIKLQLENGLQLSYLLNKMGEIDQSILLNKLNLERSCQLDNQDLTFKYYKQLGDNYKEKKDLNEALYYYQLAKSTPVENLEETANLYKAFSIIYEENKDYKQALDYSQRFENLTADLNKRNQEEVTSLMYLNSETAEKEREILQLEKEKERKQEQLKTQNRILTLLAFGVIASIIAIFYVARFYTQKMKVNQILSKQKEEINAQQIRKLEDEMRIKSLSSMVDGQEAERNRIATDLHDSLGGTLSALKLQFENLAYVTKSEKTPHYKTIFTMIDNACSEVRNIARNLKPLALEKIGLIPAIQDLVNKYNSSSDTEYTFYTNLDQGMNLDYDRKLNIYRIVQELLNNTFRHSNAQEVFIQITRQFNNLLITTEDDGIGFDQSTVEWGIGLESITSRVNILRAEMTIDSHIGQGTTIIVNIPIH